jgi:hypothetical protein
MTREHDPGVALRERFAATPPLPDGVLRAVIERLPETPQHRVPGIGPTSRRFQTMFSATKFVVAGAVVALAGGLVVSGFLPNRSEDVSAPATLPSATATLPATLPAPTPDATEATAETIPLRVPDILPATLPDDAKSGTVETAYGSARWVRVIRDASGLPAIEDLVRGQGGWLAVNQDCVEVDPGCPGMWTSTDLLGPWAEQRLPASSDTGNLRGLLRSGDAYVVPQALDDSYWLTYWLPSGQQTWHSDDAVRWDQVVTDGLPEPDREPFTWDRLVRSPVSSDTTTILPIFYRTSDVLSQLGISSAFEHVSSLAPTADQGTFEVRDGWGMTIGSIRFDESARGLRVTNVDSGAVIAETDVMDLEDIEFLSAGVTPGSSTDLALLNTRVGIVDEDGSIDLIVAPWSESTASYTEYVGTIDGFDAFVPATDGTVAHWRSTDGRSWSETAEIDLLPERAKSDCQLFVGGAQPGSWPAGHQFEARAFCHDSKSPGPWSSDDGTGWSPMLRPPKNSDLPILTTTAGPVWHGVDANTNEWWVLVDGAWARDPGLERAMRIPDRCADRDASTRTWVFGDTIVTLAVPQDRDPHPCERLVRIIEFGVDAPTATD